MRLLVCLVSAVAAALSALAPPAAAVSAPDPLRIVLTGLAPALPRPDDTLTVRGVLTNTTAQPVRGARLSVRLAPGEAGGTGGTPEAADPGHPSGPAAPGDSTDPADPGSTEAPALAPGRSGSFTLRVPVAALGLGRRSTYHLEVTLTGQDGAPLGTGRTSLVWAPGSADRPAGTDPPLRVAAFWPITDIPHMEAVSLGWGDAAQPVFRDDDLTAEFAAGGRLDALVAAASGLPVTWVLDPGLLDEARAMVAGYRIAGVPDDGDPQRSRRGHGAAVASRWLAALGSAVRKGEAASLPYADPDLASLAHSGTGGLLGPVLGDSVRWGEAVTGQALRVPVRSGLVWPYAGALDASITRLGGSLGATTYLASGQGLSTGTERSRVSIGQRATALVGDQAIGDVLSGTSGGAGDELTARQRILARLLEARRAAGGGREPLVVIPPRNLPVPAADALADALRAARDAGWITLAGLDEVESGAGAPHTARVLGSGAAGVSGAGASLRRRADAGAEDGGAAAGQEASTGRGEPAEPSRPAVIGDGGTPPGSYPQALRAGELPADDVIAVAAIQPDLGVLSRVLASPGRTADAVHRAMLRAVSTGWRVAASGGDSADQRSYAEGVRAYVDDSITSVRLLPNRGTVTMAGDAASIPVTVANGLQQPLGGLRLRVSSSEPHRVAIADPVTTVRAPPAANHTVRVRVRARANGSVRVIARLYSPDGDRPWGRPVTIRVRVGRVSPLVVAVITGGVLLVLCAGAVQLRRLKAARPTRSAGRRARGVR